MKKFINKILNVPKLIIRLWILLWLCLIILLIMKFCFGVWYPIIINNETIMHISDWIDNNFIRYIILFIFYTFNLNIQYLLSCKKVKYDCLIEILLINILILISFIIKIYSQNLSIIIEVLISIVIPIIYLLKSYKFVNKAKLVMYPIIIQLLMFAFQLNIFLVRGLDTNFINTHFIFGLLFQIDCYIFTIITWIGVTKMGLWGIWLLSKDITVLKAEKEKELKKANPNQKKIDSLDIEIARLEKEGK